MASETAPELIWEGIGTIHTPTGMYRLEKARGSKAQVQVSFITDDGESRVVRTYVSTSDRNLENAARWMYLRAVREIMDDPTW